MGIWYNYIFIISK